MVNDHSSAKVGLELDGKRERTDPRMQVQETLAGSGIVMVRGGSTARVEGWTPIACATRCVRRRRSVTILSLF